MTKLELIKQALAKVDLGESIYSRFDTAAIILTKEDGILPVGGMVLYPNTVEAFCKYLKSLDDIYRKIEALNKQEQNENPPYKTE